MIPTERQKLREAAEAATPGPWIGTEGCAVFADGDNLIADTFASGADHPGAQSIMMPWSQPQCVANAAFIALANPATVLELLATVERLERERGEWMKDGQAVVDLFDPLKARCAYPGFASFIATAAKEAHMQVRAERDAARVETERMRSVFDFACAWRDEMRRRDSTYWTGRDCELMDAIDSARSSGGKEGT